MKHSLILLWRLLVLLGVAASAGGAVISVDNAVSLRTALRQAQPGDTITLAPGDYGNGIWIENVSGNPTQRIVITGADIQNPPHFTGGTEAIHFADCNYITLRNIHVSGCSGNGINADDGGTFDTPSQGMAFENVTIEDIGPKGNIDGLKLSGLIGFVVSNCTVSGWGGSAIDMVGCRDGVIEKCRFIGKDGFSQDTGIQAKGGTERILIRRNFFKNAGQRAVNLGGSTGLQFFRPVLRDFEARNIEVAGNHFVGSTAPIAYVTSVGCRVRQNTIVNPGKWVMRILQEQPTNQFQACQQGVFEKNLILFDHRVQVFVNVGPNTRPDTFAFRSNAWFSSHGDRRPSLPTKEIGGLYQVDPLLENAEEPEMKMGSTNAFLSSVGAASY